MTHRFSCSATIMIPEAKSETRKQQINMLSTKQ